MGSMDISAHSGPEVDPYFSILMRDPSARWRRAWFLLRKDAYEPLPRLMGGCPIPYPNWENSVARDDLHRLQSLLEIVRGLL
jgi:hypothetical protein